MAKSKSLSEDVMRDLWSLAAMTGALFLATSLFTYSPVDPQLGHSLEMRTNTINACGWLGAINADFIFSLFGGAGWLTIPISVWVTLRWRARASILWLDFAAALASLMLFSNLLGFHFEQLPAGYGGKIGPGGLAGLAGSTLLKAGLGPVGTGLLLWAAVPALCLAVFDQTASALFLRFLRPFRSLWPQSIRSRGPSPVPGLQAESESSPHPEAILPSPRISAPRVSPAVLQPNPDPHWQLPPVSTLSPPPPGRGPLSRRDIEVKARLIVEKLAQFQVRGEIVASHPGPVVTVFEFKPDADIPVSRITALTDDLALALAAESLRVLAPIPGRNVVGIEASNADRDMVYLREIVDDHQFTAGQALPVCLGKDSVGQPMVVDLRQMPHAMVAGSTGSGKSVFVVSTLIGLLLKHSPRTLRLVLIDPKQVDLTLFSDIPHLALPVIGDAKRAVGALRWLAREMEKRNRSFRHFGARKLEEYNEKIASLGQEEIESHRAFCSDREARGKLDEIYYTDSLPYIVCVIEEFGDLMVVDKQNIEMGVVRLAQMARAAGIHLIIAMQSPRRDVVTGLIKTNIPARMSFKVASQVDSRVILDERGAEALLARGDMLYLGPGMSRPARCHAPWLSNAEIEAVVQIWKNQGEPEYDPVGLRMLENSPSGGDRFATGIEATSSVDESSDPMYDQVLEWVRAQTAVSASLLQRRFGLGYPRAARFIECFERENVIGPANGSKPRAVLHPQGAGPSASAPLQR